MTLRARGLQIGYGRTRVASGIDLAVRPGEVTCLLGPNGSGKTTLFKTLIGVIPPLSGEVSIDDRSLAGLSVREIAERIAYVPQQHAPTFPFRVFDVVMMGRQVHKGLFSAPGAPDHARTREVLEQLGILALADSDYSRISGGQRQMVMIARALVQDTRILVLDEPTASLDYGNQARIIGEISRLSRAGYGVVLSTHNPDHAFAVADNVALMHDGGVLAAGRPEEVLVAERLSAVYGVSMSVRRLDGQLTVCVPQYDAG
ncbi:MAG: ABC transporter ATP-binding protein [Gammaproteobacteria bacterium]|nr:ABC transporter ATP-binding protein [Gammaproteobacteria bacterium]